ncbi:MAG: hypothetical protein ACPGR2_09890 [Psychrobium sp.]
MDSNVIKAFAKNRAEEFPVDVWGLYVLPPNYEKINLFNYEKAVMIEGGRGSGKTMFLRFHCHDCRFSANREKVPLSELNKVGLYFRPDTHFCSSITSELFDKDWEKIFGKYILLNVLKEISAFSKNVSRCSFESDFNQELNAAKLPKALSNRLGLEVDSLGGLADFSEQSLASLNDWINDPDYYERPNFPDTRTLIDSIISIVRAFSPEFKETEFNLYVDEFENLTKEQQRLLNSWIKHGRHKLVISAAYKKYGDVSRNTTGSELLVIRNDYRKIDLEDFSEDEFYHFSAEILLLKLGNLYPDLPIAEYKDLLCQENHLDSRKGAKYKKTVLDFARSFLPSKSYAEVAELILKDATLRKRLVDFLIKPALDKQYVAKDFVDLEYPEESIINGILLNRKSQDCSSIITQFKELQKHKTNKFYSPYKDLLVGGILWIYLSAGRKNIPIYSGFERICNMARFNLRHFLEFCHQALVEMNDSSKMVNNSGIPEIPVEVQAKASRRNSEIEVEKVVELGQFGNTLRFIVNRLGLFFQLLQKRKAQSEPEIAHFDVNVRSMENLPEEVSLLLEQLKIWSVLVEFKGDTKRKSELNFTSSEYMLHPMFSPNFSITYRKIRKHTFSVKDIETIFCGSEDEFLKMCTPYILKSTRAHFNTAEKVQGSLFDEI